MSSLMRINPFDYFADQKGTALDEGYIWIGQPYKDPRAFPVRVFYDEAMTIPAAQPLRTSAGYVTRNGAPALIYVGGNYSILVQDKKHRLVWMVRELVGVQSNTVINSMAELRLLDPSLYNSAEVLKYSDIAPWYVGKYVLDPADFTTPDNGGTVVVGVNNSRWKLKSPLLISPEIFGCTGMNTLDDSEPMGRFLDAVISGRSATARSEARYKINSVLTRTLTSGQAFRWDLNGAKLMQGANNTMLNLLNSADGPISGVSSVTNVPYNLGNGTQNTIVARMVGGQHPFTAIGQIGKIFSDDRVPDADAANQYCGEYFVVGAIESPTVFYATGVFDETYTSGIKVVRPSDAVVHIENLSGQSVWADNITASMFTLSGFLSPRIDKFRAQEANATALNLTGNCRAEVNGAIGRKIKNRPDLSSFGYFINDSAGWGSTIRGIDCVHARHAYTTSTPSTPPGDDRWWLRGRTIGGHVIDGRGQGCANAFDTHSPALRIKFTNCTPVDDYRGFDTGGAGIQIRGNDCEVINCDVSQSRIGVAQSGAAKTSNCRLNISGLKYRGPTAHIPVIINGSTSFSTFVEFTEGDISTQAQQAFDVTNALLVIRDTNVALNPVDTDASAVSLNAGGNVRWYGGSYNLLGGTGASIIRHRATNTTGYAEDLRVTGVTASLSYFAISAAQYAIESRFRRLQLDAALPGVPFLGFEVEAPKVSASYMVGYAGRPFGYRAIAYTTTGNQTINLQFAGDDAIFARLESTVAGVVINAVTQGAFPGQQLVINCRTTSPNAITLANNSAGLLALGVAVGLAPGRGVILVWDGTVWRLGSFQ